MTKFSNIKYISSCILYRLSIPLDANPSATLQKILDTGPYDDMSSIHCPLNERTLSFSAKLHNLRRTPEAAHLREDEAFPFLYDGRRIGKGTNTPLEAFPNTFLDEDDMLSVETNISTYDMLTKGVKVFPFPFGKSFILVVLIILRRRNRKNRKRLGGSPINGLLHFPMTIPELRHFYYFKVFK